MRLLITLCLFSNFTFAAQIMSELALKEVTATQTPISGHVKIYPKTDKKLYYMDGDGVEQEVGSGSGGYTLTDPFTATSIIATASITAPSFTNIEKENFLQDGGFELGVSEVTCTVGTCTSTTTAAQGSKALKIAASAETASATISFTNAAYAGRSLGISCEVKSATTTAELCGWTPAGKQNCVAVSDVAGWQRIPTYVIADSSGNFGLRVGTSASATTDIFIDQCKVVTDAFVCADLQQENNYSARITSSASISNQTGDFIASVTNTGTGLYTVVFKAGVFTVTPSIVVTVNTASLSRVGVIYDHSATGFKVKLADDSGSVGDYDFFVAVQKMGVDYKAPAEHVLSPMTATTTTFSTPVLLAAVPVVKTCRITDTKAYDAACGTSSNDTIHTRTLDDIDTSSDCSFVSLASNIATVGKGSYCIRGVAAGFRTGRTVLDLYNQSSVISTGVVSYSEASAGEGVTPSIESCFEVSSTLGLSLRQYVTSGVADSGLGLASNNSGTDTICSEMTITKYK